MEGVDPEVRHSIQKHLDLGDTALLEYEDCIVLVLCGTLIRVLERDLGGDQYELCYDDECTSEKILATGDSMDELREFYGVYLRMKAALLVNDTTGGLHYELDSSSAWIRDRNTECREETLRWSDCI